MLRDTAFGQYFPTQSFVHSMDARAKFVISVIFIVSIFVSASYVAFAACALFLVLAVAFSGVPVRSVLKNIKPIIILIIFSVVINMLFYRAGNVVLSLGFLHITDEAIKFSALMALRLILLITSSSMLTLTTTPVDLTDAIESLLKPLNIIKFPVHELALIMSIALRFIPTLMEETDRIISAQKARGADFESGNLWARAKSMLPVLVPLLTSAFRRADELADAMDSRCYSGAKGRTKMKKHKFGYRDFVALFAALNILAFVIIDKVMFLFPLI